MNAMLTSRALALFETLRQPMNRPRNRWLLWLTLITYSALLALVKTKHELWLDEGQAWLLARDIGGFFELHFKQLRYEGSTGLWHTILMLPAKIGLPYQFIKAISFIIAVGGVYVLLRYSPFPSIITLLITFSFYTFYQYGVISRNYVLFLPILFGLAALDNDRLRKPWEYGILLFLLSHSSVHGAAMSAVLCIRQGYDVFIGKRSKYLEPEWKAAHTKMAIIMALNFLMITYQLWPPHDLTIGKRTETRLHILIERANVILIHCFTDRTVSSFLTIFATAVVAWKARTLLVFVGLIASQLAIFTMKYMTPWHEGLVVLVWIYAAWISWNSVASDSRGRWMRRALIVMMVVTLATQVRWSYRSAISDYHLPYTGAQRAARYMERRFPNEEYVWYMDSLHGLAVMPYFKKNVFENYNFGRKPTYYDWSWQIDLIQQSQAWIDINDPDILLISLRKPLRNEIREAPQFNGYKPSEVFAGKMFWKDSIFEDTTFMLYERDPAWIPHTPE